MKFFKKEQWFTTKLNNFLPVVLGLLGATIAINAGAANAYFDVNGTAPGYGVTASGTYSWDDPNWATVTGGTSATAAWVPGSFARFPGGVNYTVTVNNPESMAGLLLNNDAAGANTVTINAAGSGSLDVLPNGTLTAGLPTQGFFGQGSTVTINAPITGTGGVQIPTGGGSIQLYGANTYSGGTTLSSSATLTYINNDNSFGTGPIALNSSSGSFPAILNPLGTVGSPLTITLANTWTNFTGGFVNFASSSYDSVVCTGPWYLQAFNTNIRNNGDTTASLTLSGVINGSGTLTFSGNNAGTITLSGANKYTGKTLIAGGGNVAGVGIILKVGSLNKVSGGTPSSNLGAPTTAANGTIGIGSSTFASTLLYNGPGETSDRVIDLAGTTGGAKIQTDGTGALVLTAVNTATGVGAKTLTLQGANTGANSIGKIVNSSSGATTVAKAQAGTWKLTGANTYSGGTIVSAGTLEISGSVVGNVTNTAGTLILDSASALSSSTILAATSGATVNLNYSGTNNVNGIVIDGSSLASGVWGSPSSGAPNTNPIFTGTGKLNILGTPVIVLQPVSGSVFPDSTFTFTVGVADPTGLTYQWKQNGNNVSGANSSSYTISPVEAANAGAYVCWVTNAFGFTNSTTATLTVMGTNAYTETIRTDSPISYWRLDETNGTLAYDAIGGNLGQYRNALLNQPGYSLTDSDPGIGLPASTAAGRGYVSVTNITPFIFLGAPPFTLEGWAYFTNLTGVQRLFSTLNLTAPGGWAFGINGNNAMRFTAGAVADKDQALNSALVTGVWYHLALSCDGNTYHFYVNGVEMGAGQSVASAAGVAVPLTLGSNPPGYTNNAAGDPLGEQVKGRIDEFAIYNYGLSTAQLLNHYNARYADAPLPVAALPVINPPTNYVSLATTLQENAAGVNLSYQWFKVGSGAVSGASGSALTLSPLQLSDAGNYYVQVSNNAGSTNSPTNYVAVLPIPTNASQLNLTNGLVLHLPFDSDYADISGRSNNGTNVGATTMVSPGVVGANALHYSSDAGSSSFNYVTLGVRPDLQFGTSTDFTVAYWVRQPSGSTFTNLPFFANEPVGSTTGWMFAPYQTATTAGGWSEAIGSMSSPSGFTSFPDSDLINDGNWHLLVHSAQRSANVVTYLDGAQVDSQAIGFLGSLSTTTPANIGQDSSGAYPVTAQADLDDLAVWTRTLTPLEVSGIYLAGATNHVSFAPAVANPIVQVAIQIQKVGGSYQLIWAGSGGTLQASGDVTGTYTNVPSASSPYTIPTPLGAHLFYRLKY